MRDGYWDRDGSRTQGWMNRRMNVRRHARPIGDTTTRLGLIISVHYKDTDTNQSDSFTEYDILMLDSFMVFKNVSVASLRRSYDSGDEATLVAASSIPDLSEPSRAHLNIMESDGDLVLVTYINNYKPIIIGVVNHLKAGQDTATWNGTSSDGVRRAFHHKNSSIIMEENSNINIKIPDDKSVTFSIDGNQVLKLYATGSTLKVDLIGGSEKVVLGETFISWLNANYGGHTHTAPGGATGVPISGPYGPPGIGATDSDFLSDDVKTD